jgi:hypothetical protein
MMGSRATDEVGPGCPDARNGQSAAAIFAVCLLLFVDVQIPFIGNSNRFIAVLILAVLLFGRSGTSIPMPFCAAMAFLLPVYYLVPPLAHPDVDARDFVTVLVFQMACVVAAVFLARALSTDGQRRQLTDMLIFFALAAATAAILQRYGLLAPLGRDRWGYATTASDNLRGAGFMADPNFLAIALASVVPLAVNWRFTQFRWPAIVILGLGVNATDSRAGIFFAVLALALSLTGRLSSRRAVMSAKGQKFAAVVGVCLIVLFALNVGGQRDRVVEGVLIQVGLHSVVEGSVDEAAAISARDRRELLGSWVEVGVDSLPFGGGIGAQDKVVANTGVTRAAHNTFAQTFGQGGVAGLLIGLTTLLCLACFIRRRSEPFAIMGIVIVAGGLVLSFPGTVFLVVPMGLADGIRAAQLGRPTRRASPSSASHHLTHVQTHQRSAIQSQPRSADRRSR